MGKSKGSGLLSLLLVNKLHQNTLVFEAITFALEVELMVQMLVNFLGFSVLSQQIPQDSHAANPHDLHRHTSVGSTLPLAMAHVTALAACQSILANTGT